MPFSDPHRHFEDVLTAIEKIEEFAGNMVSATTPTTTGPKQRSKKDSKSSLRQS